MSIQVYYSKIPIPNYGHKNMKNDINLKYWVLKIFIRIPHNKYSHFYQCWKYF